MKFSHNRSILAVCCLIFFSFGVAMSVMGPLLPELAIRTHSSLSAAGAIFTASFLGSLLTELAAGPISDRMGQARVLLVGLAIYVLGLIGLILTGMLIVCTNVLVARTFPHKSVVALNLSNLAWGIGAVLGPAAAGWALSLWHTAIPAVWVGIGCLVFTMPFVFLMSRRQLPAASIAAPVASKKVDSMVYRSPLLWVSSSMLMVYVGTESGIGGWAATYIDRTTSLGLGTGALVASGFWLALTLGRLIGTLLGSRVKPHTVVRMCLCGAAIGAPILALSAGHAELTIAAVLLMGLSFGAFWPTSFAILMSSFTHAPGAAGSVATGMGSAGGMWIPWLMGVLLEHRGPGASMLLVIGGVAGIIALYMASRALVTAQLSLQKALVS